jgi:hypothetical protein
MSNLNPPGSRVVQRLVFELVVVLLGVFLAIRLEGWADDTAQKRAALETLETLRTELEADRAEMDRISRAQADFADGMRRLATLLRGDSEPHLEEIETLLLEDLTPNPTWFPQSAAYEMLLSTGQAAALDNPELEVALARLFRRSYVRLVYNGEIYDQAYLEEFRRTVTRRWDYTSGRLFSFREADNRDLANAAGRIVQWANTYRAVLSEYAPELDSVLDLMGRALDGA